MGTWSLRESFYHVVVVAQTMKPLLLRTNSPETPNRSFKALAYIPMTNYEDS